MNTRPTLSTLLSQTARAARSPLSLCAVALALAACSTSSPSTSSAPTATTPVAAAPAPAAPEPVMAAPAPASPAPVAMNASIDFDKQVQPFFAEYCVRCHSGRNPAGRLNFAGAADLKRAAGNSDNSRIYNVITASRGHMPPRSAPQPSADDIAMIKQWIDQGAQISADYPAGTPSADGPGGDD